MKKLIILLLVLLGTMPLETWQSGTPEQQKAFMHRIADIYGNSIGCAKGMLTVLSDKDTVYFHFNCEEMKPEKPGERRL